jgi:phenylacetic acid degradation operon negative regulatory protein
VLDTPDPETTATVTGRPATLPLDPADGGVPTRLLVFGMAHDDGSVHAAELFRVAEECGISVETARSCLRRLVGDGLFDRRGEGREAIYRATPSGQAVMQQAHRRHLLAYAQDAAGRGWDRRWRLVAFAIPEARRAARDILRDRLRELGGAAVQPGLYLSPHPWDDAVRELAAELDLVGNVCTMTTDDLVVGGQRDPKALAAQLWPLGDIAARYRSFIATYRDVPRALESMRRRRQRLGEADFLPGALHMAIRFNECFESDPLLPPELLPKPWPGREARDLLVRCRRQGVLAREHKHGPSLFHVFDETVAQLP